MQKNNPASQAISPNTPARARLFFALWPDIACRKQLTEAGRNLASACGGRQMRADTLHMTLLFIGSVDRGCIPLLEAAAAELRWPGFELGIDHLACWRHNRIAYAAPEQVPAALIQLVSQLREAVEAAGIGFDRKPFVPHVTVLRNIERNFGIQKIDALPWRVSSYALVESLLAQGGVRYRILQSWGANQSAHAVR